jgi:hypothetical protein
MLDPEGKLGHVDRSCANPLRLGFKKPGPAGPTLEADEQVPCRSGRGIISPVTQRPDRQQISGLFQPGRRAYGNARTGFCAIAVQVPEAPIDSGRSRIDHGVAATRPPVALQGM